MGWLEDVKQRRKARLTDAARVRYEKQQALLAKKREKSDALYAQKLNKLGVEIVQEQPVEVLPPPPPKRPKVGLCLGGGGARGIAHIGAIQAFREAGITFDLLAGTSIGSMIGAMYAAGVDTGQMMEYAAGLSMKDIKKGPIWSPDDSQKIGKIVKDIIGERNIEDLLLPYYAVAVNLITGKEVILDRGSVSAAVAASCTVPLFFKPLKYKDMRLVDGGLLNNIPADVCRMMGAEKVITVDVNPTRGGGTSQTGMFSVLRATFSIMGANASLNGLLKSDVIIAPDMSKFKSTDKTGYEEMYQRGYEAARAKIPVIRAVLNEQPSEEELKWAEEYEARSAREVSAETAEDNDLTLFSGEADEYGFVEAIERDIKSQKQEKKTAKKTEKTKEKRKPRS